LPLDSSIKEGGMNKRGLVDAVAAAAGMQKTVAEKAVESVLATIKKNAKKGVQLIGFGSFSVVKRKAREGRNPKTGAVFFVKASNVIKFRPGTKFKEQVN
jgi:DNA-binding protein HU-beta